MMKGNADEALQILTEEYKVAPGAWLPIVHVSLFDPIRNLPGCKALLASEEKRGAAARRELKIP